MSARARSTADVLGRVYVYLKPYKLMAIGTIACAILSLSFGLVFPKLIRFIIDEVIDGGRRDLLPMIIMAILGAFIFRDVFNTLRILINNHYEQNVIFDMRNELFRRLQRLPIGYFDQRASGDLMTRVIEDVNTVERVLIDGIEQGTVAVLSVIGILALLLISDPTLTGFALIPLPLLIGGALWYTTTAHSRYRRQRRAASAMNAQLMDNLQGVRQIKAFGREKHEDRRFSEKAEELRQGTLSVMRAWAVYSPGMNLASWLGLPLVLWIGGTRVLDQTMSEGQLAEFLIYLMMLYAPIGKLHSLNQMIAGTRAAGERVFDILDSPVERSDSTNLRELQLPVRGDVKYENVCFGYNDDRQVLKDASLHAKPGQMIALVGPTGAGKSTLVDLMSAFYEHTSGRIAIDGQDIKEISLESLRGQIAIVTQEAFLFNGTIRENILYGRLDATDEELSAAAKAANCHEFIERLPDGFDSRVGERGVKLSVGEKQRVSIARAILANAPILILDEATASVDTHTEKLIQEALEHLMQGRTSFVIAHRLSTIRNADQILVIRHGEIVERGSHEELLTLDGLYAKLSHIQNTTFIEEGFEKLEVN
ncbi:MAG: ATP-binding cassette subfamily B protein [Candidatus Binatia bacterium]|jgi:ATP-binding cassette subfamily B protein